MTVKENMCGKNEWLIAAASFAKWVALKSSDDTMDVAKECPFCCLLYL